jgi:hypothetical protein
MPNAKCNAFRMTEARLVSSPAVFKSTARYSGGISKCFALLKQYVSCIVCGSRHGRTPQGLELNFLGQKESQQNPGMRPVSGEDECLHGLINDSLLIRTTTDKIRALPRCTSFCRILC